MHDGCCRVSQKPPPSTPPFITLGGLGPWSKALRACPMLVTRSPVCPRAVSLVFDIEQDWTASRWPVHTVHRVHRYVVAGGRSAPAGCCRDGRCHASFRAHGHAEGFNWVVGYSRSSPAMIVPDYHNLALSYRSQVSKITPRESQDSTAHSRNTTLGRYGVYFFRIIPGGMACGDISVSQAGVTRQGHGYTAC